MFVTAELQSGATQGTDHGNGAESIFLCGGDYWQVAFRGTAFLLRDTRGLRYLWFLLANPGRKFSAKDFAAGLLEHRDMASEASGDERARVRLLELRSELDDAESLNDLGHSARIHAEIGLIVDELSDRGLRRGNGENGSAMERARKSVTNAIRRALSAIERHNPTLAAHLAASVRTGAYVSYNPDPLCGLRWRCDSGAC